MSKDIIYREDAIKAVENVSENYTKEGDREWHPHIDFITQALVEVPSAPSADRPSGEWIPSDTDGFVCSVCKNGYRNQPTLMGRPMFEYCPVCGARMKGADDETD